MHKSSIPDAIMGLDTMDQHSVMDALGVFAFLLSLGLGLSAFISLRAALYRPEDIKNRTTGFYWLRFSMFSIASVCMFGVELYALSTTVLYS